MTREPLYKNEAEKVGLIERNLFLQSHRVAELALTLGKTLRITVELIQELHFFAIQDIYSCAGQFRTWKIKIIGSRHTPPGGDFVEGQVQEMCDRVNSDEQDLIVTAAYLLWKSNWIHPFGGGNGRTARAATYLFLCGRLGFLLPGQPTLGPYIVENRGIYLDALHDADLAWRQGVIDVSKMTSLLDAWLKKQLGSVPAHPRPVVVQQSVNPSTLEPVRVIHSGRPTRSSPADPQP